MLELPGVLVAGREGVAQEGAGDDEESMSIGISICEDNDSFQFFALEEGE
jgi:hypothetical protein